MSTTSNHFQLVIAHMLLSNRLLMPFTTDLRFGFQKDSLLLDIEKKYEGRGEKTYVFFKT